MEEHIFCRFQSRSSLAKAYVGCVFPRQKASPMAFKGTENGYVWHQFDCRNCQNNFNIYIYIKISKFSAINSAAHHFKEKTNWNHAIRWSTDRLFGGGGYSVETVNILKSSHFKQTIYRISNSEISLSDHTLFLCMAFWKIAVPVFIPKDY